MNKQIFITLLFCFSINLINAYSSRQTTTPYSNPPLALDVGRSFGATKVMYAAKHEVGVPSYKKPVGPIDPYKISTEMPASIQRQTPPPLSAIKRLSK